jgi:hypothetical protein
MMQARNQHEAGNNASFLLGLFFDPEDVSDMFLRNVGRLSTGYKALNPRR